MARSRALRPIALCLLLLLLAGCRTAAPAVSPAPSPAISIPAPIPQDELPTLVQSLTLSSGALALDPAATTSRLLFAQSRDGTTLALVRLEGIHAAGLGNLVCAVLDDATRQPVGQLVTLPGDDGRFSTWETGDTLSLLCTNSTTNQGWQTSAIPLLLSYDGTGLTQIAQPPQTGWTGPGLATVPSVPDVLSPSASDFWADRLARPIPGGLLMYGRDSQWEGQFGVPDDGTQDLAAQWYYTGLLPLTGDTEVLSAEGVQQQAAQYMIADWYHADADRRDERAYLADSAPPDVPQPEDRRIDKVTLTSTRPTYETEGVCYRVSTSTYHQRADTLDWVPMEDVYLVLGKDPSGLLYEVRGSAGVDRPPDTVIQEVTWGLMDLEVTLWRDGEPHPAGPGSTIQFFQDMPQEKVLTGWTPIYREGDQWVQMQWPDFTAVCYRQADGRYRVNSIDTTRTDLETTAGLRIGSTTDEVAALYPEIETDTYYWSMWEKEDLLVVMPWGVDSGLGPAIRLYFQGDQVSRIALENLFD